MRRLLSNLTLYRLRYLIGFTVGLVVIIAVILIAMLHVPGGLRSAEISSVITSTNFSLDHTAPDSIINLPYHLLQQLAIALFGFNLLGIKLPSLVFAIGAIIGIFLFLRELYKPNVAFITLAISSVMPAFIFTAQDATPIMYTLCLSSWLLVAATFAARSVGPVLFWKIFFAFLFALNLYAPIGIYLNIALLAMAIYHPHIRHFVRKLNKYRLVAGILVAMIVISPLLFAIIKEPRLLLVLLGWHDGTVFSLAHTFDAAKLLFDFSGKTELSGIIAPIVPIHIAILSLIGIYYFVRNKYTAQSSILTVWGVLLVVLALIDPVNGLYALILIILLIASAINGILSSWYRIFPHNPYAHIVALFPIGIIVSGIFAVGLTQYGEAYYYDRATVGSFSNDIRLLPKALDYANISAKQPATLIVSSDQVPFYRAFAKYDNRFYVSDSLPNSTPSRLIIDHDSYSQNRGALATLTPARIITNRLATAADRFYIYTN